MTSRNLCKLVSHVLIGVALLGPILAHSQTAATGLAQPNCVLPVYPLISHRNQDAGVVSITARRSPEGTLDQVAIVKSAGSPPLDEASMEAVARCRFPARKADEKAPEDDRLQVNFAWGIWQTADRVGSGVRITFVEPGTGRSIEARGAKMDVAPDVDDTCT